MLQMVAVNLLAKNTPSDLPIKSQTHNTHAHTFHTHNSTIITLLYCCERTKEQMYKKLRPKVIFIQYIKPYKCYSCCPQHTYTCLYNSITYAARLTQQVTFISNSLILTSCANHPIVLTTLQLFILLHFTLNMTRFLLSRATSATRSGPS